MQRSEDGGIASEQLEFVPRAFFELGRRNLFGKNRSVNVFARVSLRPKETLFFTDPGSALGERRKTVAFSEYRLLGTFRESRALGTGPTSADHLLEPGELRARFDVDGWDVLFYEETSEPEAVARLAARKN